MKPVLDADVSGLSASDQVNDNPDPCRYTEPIYARAKAPKSCERVRHAGVMNAGHPDFSHQAFKMRRMSEVAALAATKVGGSRQAELPPTKLAPSKLAPSKLAFWRPALRSGAMDSTEHVVATHFFGVMGDAAHGLAIRSGPDDAGAQADDLYHPIDRRSRGTDVGNARRGATNPFRDPFVDDLQDVLPFFEGVPKGVRW